MVGGARKRLLGGQDHRAIGGRHENMPWDHHKRHFVGKEFFSHKETFEFHPETAAGQSQPAQRRHFKHHRDFAGQGIFPQPEPTEPLPHSTATVPSFLPPLPPKFSDMSGPRGTQTNWLVRGHVLLGGYPGQLSEQERLNVLRRMAEVGINMLVCLQQEMLLHNTDAAYPERRCISLEARRGYMQGVPKSVKPYMDLARRAASVAGAKPPRFLHFAIPPDDTAVGSDEATLQFVNDLTSYMKGGARLYIHCHDGNGRTGTVAALLLARLYGLSSHDALERVQLYRDTRVGLKGQCPETHAQKSQVGGISELDFLAFLRACANTHANHHALHMTTRSPKQ